MEQRYMNREIDAKFEEVHTRFDTQDKTLVEQDRKLDKILTQVTYTNGKVRRITMALVIVGVIVSMLLMQNGSKFYEFALAIVK